jgi:hypothetical protein
VSTHRPELAELSTSELAFLARIKPATARRKLAEGGLEPARVDGRTRWWDSRLALPVLLDLGSLNPQQERARLDRARAELAEHQLAERKGEYVAGADVEAFLVRVCGGMSQRMQAVPGKAAPEVRAASSDAEAEALLREHVHEALTELADACREVGERVEQRAKGNR